MCSSFLHFRTVDQCRESSMSSKQSLETRQRIPFSFCLSSSFGLISVTAVIMIYGSSDSWWVPWLVGRDHTVGKGQTDIKPCRENLGIESSFGGCWVGEGMWSEREKEE